MKLSDYAKRNDIQYRAAWNRYKAGKIPGAWQDEFGTIHVPDPVMVDAKLENTAVVYARVSDASQRENLNRQADRAVDWAIAQGLHVVEVVKEVGSGVSDTRPKLHKLLKKTSYSTIVVEYKDRLTRFGFAWFETLATTSGKRILVMNPSEGQREDIVADLTSVIYSFTARMYGQRRAARAKAKLAQELRPQEATPGEDGT